MNAAWAWPPLPCSAWWGASAVRDSSLALTEPGSRETHYTQDTTVMSRFEDFWAILKDRRPALSPVAPADAALSRSILKADLFSGKNGDMVESCRAGLLLLNDDLDAAHNIVQHIETPTGSFWHAIIHRREGDFSNARYWWHRTGTHPVFEEIYDIVLHRVPDFSFMNELRELRRWDPVAFTDRCQRAQPSQETTYLEEIQAIEMRALLQWGVAQVK